jgi:hypothetical protein
MDANGLPVQLGLTPGEAHDNRLCPELLMDCSRNQCCWQIGDMTLTGSGRSSVNEARGLTFCRSAIEKSRFVLALSCIARATSSSGSLTRSSSVGVLPPARQTRG